jgi:hypothetical protein
VRHRGPIFSVDQGGLAFVVFCTSLHFRPVLMKMVLADAEITP